MPASPALLNLLLASKLTVVAATGAEPQTPVPVDRPTVTTGTTYEILDVPGRIDLAGDCKNNGICKCELA